MDDQLRAPEYHLSPKAAEYALQKTLLAEQLSKFEAERLLLLSRRKNATLSDKKAQRQQRRLDRASHIAFAARERRLRVESAIVAHSQTKSMLGLVDKAIEDKERVGDDGKGDHECHCEAKEELCGCGGKSEAPSAL